MSKETADSITMLLIKLFEQAGRVTENGLIAFQGLCVGLGDKIDLAEIGRYLKVALK